MKKYLLIWMSLLLWQISVVAQERTISGKVVSSEDGQPLPGVTVQNKALNAGVATDLDGHYTIKAQTGNVLVFSFVGMESQEVKVGASNVIDITLKPESKQMEEVVIIAYGGPRKKGTITGSVSTVKNDIIEAKPVASFDQALQGQVAGVQITTSSGEPTASSSVRIRGTGSFSASTAPLYIMDGVAITEGDYTTLNTNDIENITVLKDASATSIYGARAANGVIVITTKRGKYGQAARINFRAMYGVSNLLDGGFDMMNTAEILELEEELGIRYSGDAATQELMKTDTDWKDAMFRQGKIQNYELSVNGGSEKLIYYLSGSFYQQEGIAPRSGLKRFVFRSNLEGRMKEWLKIGSNISLGYSTSQQTESGNSVYNPAVAALVTKPYYSPYKADGSYVEAWDATENPLYVLEQHPGSNEDVKLVGSFFAELNPVEGLYIKSLWGVDGVVLNSHGKSLPGYVQNEEGGGTATESFGRSYRFTITNTVNYQPTFENTRHSLILLLGQEMIRYKSNSFSATNRGIMSDKLTHLGAGTVSSLATGGAPSGYSYLSWFGRAEYNFDAKYFIDFSLRADGSSRFAKGNRWAKFWSTGLRWNLAKESFFPESFVLTDAQLFGSVGTTGNAEIGYYDYMSWVTNGAIYNQVDGMRPSTTTGNPDITWEKSFETNLGVELNLFNRWNLRAEWYRRKKTDLLMDVPVSYLTGYTSRTENVGELTNTGVEVTVGGDVIRNLGGFNWNLNANFAYNRSRIDKLYDGADEFMKSSMGEKYKVGKSLGSYFMPRFAGVNPANGDALWYDKEGNVVNEYSEDNAVFLGKSYLAPWNGGFTSTFSYKGLSLSAFFNWVAGRYVMNNNRFFIENTGVDYVAEWNQSRKMLKRWQKPGDVTDIPRSDQTTQINSDQWIDDASFLRLKNVTLSYNLPQAWMKKTNLLSAVRLYAQGQNLITWTKFEGFDPEDDTNVTFGRYPTARQFTFGIDVTF